MCVLFSERPLDGIDAVLIVYRVLTVTTAHPPVNIMVECGHFFWQICEMLTGLIELAWLKIALDTIVGTILVVFTNTRLNPALLRAVKSNLVRFGLV